MTEGVLDGLSDLELKRYRGVLRKRYGLALEVFDMGGSAIARLKTVEPAALNWNFYARVMEARVIFYSGGHQWVEVHTGIFHSNLRAFGKRGGWTKDYKFTVPLP